MSKFYIGDVVHFKAGPSHRQDLDGALVVVIDVRGEYVVVRGIDGYQWTSVHESHFYPVPRIVMQDGAEEYEEAMAGAELLAKSSPPA